jgi:hypothetical protein
VVCNRDGAELPLFERLSGVRSVLIAGAGGGFDVYTGIPLFLTLREQHDRCSSGFTAVAPRDGRP